MRLFGFVTWLVRKTSKIFSKFIPVYIHRYRDRDGPFASNDFWGDIKFRKDRFIAFWSRPLSLARATLRLLLVFCLLQLFFFFTDVSSFEKRLFLDRFSRIFLLCKFNLLKVFGSVFAWQFFVYHSLSF